jgi:hypothetical protein
MSEQDVAVAVETPQPQPTIAESYLERTSDASGIAESSKRKPRAAAPEPEERGAHLAKTEPKQSLSDAFDGAAPPEAETFELPAEFTPYESDAIEAILGLMGLTESDLLDPEQAALVLAELEEAFPLTEQEGEQEAGEEEGEEEEQEPAEQAKPEEKKPVLPTPQSVAEYVGNDPEKLKTLNEHIEATYQRARSMSDPVMTDVFVTGLAKALGTPAENLPALKDVADILSYGGYSLVEAALPKLLPQLMHGFLAENFGPILESYAPGLGDAFRVATIENTWHDCLAMDEFKDMGLPRFNTPEFQAAADKVHAANPWLNSFDPAGPDGKPLPILEALKVKAQVTARLLSGERISPKQLMEKIAEATAAGKRDAERTNRRVSASRIMRGSRSRKSAGANFDPPSERESLLSAFKGHSNQDMDGIA